VSERRQLESGKQQHAAKHLRGGGVQREVNDAEPECDWLQFPRGAGFDRYAFDAASSLSGVTLSGSMRTIR